MKKDTTHFRRFLIVCGAAAAIGVLGALASQDNTRHEAVVPQPVQVVAAPAAAADPMDADAVATRICASEGIAPGAPCDAYFARANAEAEANNKADLERQVAEAQERYENPAAHCSAVLNTCY